MNDSSNPILVTGASGLLGRYVLRELRRISRGRPVIAAGRTAPAESTAEFRLLDLKTGEGTADSVRGVHTIYHLASATRGFDRSVDVDGTRNLLAAAKAAGAEHIVYISIVGIDRVPLNYYKYKLETEKVVRECKIPYTILRATQFHEFLDFIMQKFLRFPVSFIPKAVLYQPIETAVVAERLCALGEGPPHNAILEIGGPESADWGTLAEKWLKATGRRRWVVGLPAWLLGKTVSSTAAGGLLTTNAAPESITWDQYLQRAYGDRNKGARGRKSRRT